MRRTGFLKTCGLDVLEPVYYTTELDRYLDQKYDLLKHNDEVGEKWNFSDVGKI